MALGKLKAALINLYDRATAKKATISVGDIVNLRTEIESNQFLVTTRLLDIEDFCEKGIKSFYWQNTISRKAYGEKHRELAGNAAFTRLIESYKENGYDPASEIVVDKDLRLLDGNHRMGMNLFEEIETINVRVLKRKSHNPTAIDWYLKVGLESEFIAKVLEKYSSIQQKMMDSGNVFCAVLPDEALARDFVHLTNRSRVDVFSGLPVTMWRGDRLPTQGMLIRFTLHEPQYYTSSGNVYARRAEQIRDMIQSRTEHPVIVACNCLEGKALFEQIKPYILLTEEGT